MRQLEGPPSEEEEEEVEMKLAGPHTQLLEVITFFA